MFHVHMRRWPLLVALFLALISSGGVTAGAGAPATGAIALRFSSLALADGVRYSLVLQRPPGTELQGIEAEVFLPEGSDGVQLLETPGLVTPAEQRERRLRWRAADLEADSPAPVFSFLLAGAPAEELVAVVRWSGPTAGEESASVQGVEFAATASRGEATLSSGQASALGETGVQVSALDERGAGAEVWVERLNRDANPAEDVTPGLWWCALLDLSGVPEGAALAVTAPLRQALTPDAEVLLLAERDGAWTPLDGRGRVSADGQFVSFIVFGGGRYALGTGAVNQSGLFTPITPGSGRPDLAVASADFHLDTTNVKVTQVNAGQDIVLAANVRNLSGNRSQPFTVTITAPAALPLRQPIPAQPSTLATINCTAGSANSVTCSVTALDPQRGVNLRLPYATVATATTQACVQVQVSGNAATDANLQNNTLTSCLTIAPAGTTDLSLSLARTSGSAPIVPSTLTYEARVQREVGSFSGPITLRLQFDIALKNITLSGSAVGAVWSCTALTVSGVPIANGFTCTLPGPANAGFFPTLEISARFESCRQGSMAQSASLIGLTDLNAPNNSATLTEQADCPRYSITATDALDPIRLGQTQTWTITVRNTGAVATSARLHVKLTLPKPEAGSFTNAIWNGTGGSGPGWTCSGSSGTSAIASCFTDQILQPGASSTITITSRWEAISLLQALSCLISALPLGGDLDGIVEVSGGGGVKISAAVPTRLRECI